MARISHQQAISLEHLISKLFGKERHELMWGADADILETSPHNALLLVSAPIYYNNNPEDIRRFTELANKYVITLCYSDDPLEESVVDAYIEDLGILIKDFIDG